MNRTVTTSVAVSALVANAILCAPCAGPTAMAEQSSQQSDAPRLPKAELIKTITEPPAPITPGSSLDEFVGRVMNWKTEIEP